MTKSDGKNPGNGATDLEIGYHDLTGLTEAIASRYRRYMRNRDRRILPSTPWRVPMNIDPNATKYMVKAKISADGIIDRPDVVGAIFGQTEGLLGDELDLRDLQKSGRIGRIEVETVTKGGKSEGIIYMSSSLDQVETVILASALETVDRVGPCKASVHVLGIEDVRVTKREKVVERAKELLNELMKQSEGSSTNLMNSVKQSVQVEEITTYGPDRCPAGPNVKDSEAIIIVEGRSDVLNLLKAGIKNAIAVEGTNIPKTVQDLSRERVVTAFTDGDRGGELILRELFQVAEVDFVARAPRAHEVEELSSKQIVKCLRNKVPGDQYMEMNNLSFEEKSFDELDKFEPEGDYRRDRKDRDRHDRKDHDERRKDRDNRENRGDRKDHDERRKERFNNEALDKYRKKREERQEREEKDMDVVSEPEPAEEPVAEQPAIEEPAEVEDKPKKSTKRKAKDEEDKPKKSTKRKAKDEEPAKEPAEEKAEESVEDAPKEEKPAKARSLRGKKLITDKVLTPEQESYRDMLLELSTTHNAKVLDAENNVIRQVAVKSLVNSLKEDNDAVSAIVFDGVISQRIIDVSSEKGIKIVVGTRKGNISKMPADVTIWTKEDLV
ncbi:DNA primase DnaG [methanogenic archaeon mixed culture ISO4-G1]|nr:DNA primase DnaG [methanogenic archaeon mixed culture ISO4-G1]